MPYLTLAPNGGGSPTTIAVQLKDPPVQRSQDVGLLSVAFDGTTHDSRRARPRRWTGVQTIVTAAAGSALKALLEGMQPLQASGTLMDGSTVPVYCTSPEINGVIPGYVRLIWDMWE